MAFQWRRGPHYMNSRGPYLEESLIDRENSPCRVDRIASVAMEFDFTMMDAAQGDVVTVLHHFLADHGIRSPEQARALVDIPATPCPVVLDKRVPTLRVSPTTDPADVVRAAVLLGLSTISRYDPNRPVVWTTASLNRSIILVDTSRFYSMETRYPEKSDKPEPTRVAMGGFYALD